MSRQAPPLESPWVLHVRPPGGDERMVRLDRTVLHIGSATDCDIVLDARHGVSGQHCTLRLSGRECILLDRGSKNGSFVNSERCTQPTRLRDRDKISIGTYTIEIRAVVQSSATGTAATLPTAVPLTFSPDDRYAAALDRFTVYAREWDTQRRPRKLLLDRTDQRIVSKCLIDATLFARIRTDPLLSLYIDTSLRARSLHAPIVFWTVVVGAATWMLCTPRSNERDDAEVTASEDSAGDPPPPDLPKPDLALDRPSPPLQSISHERIPGETLKDIASLYHVSQTDLERWNPHASVEADPRETLRVYTTLPALVRREETYVVKSGEGWDSISEELGIRVRDLKAFNPHVSRPTKGDMLSNWVEVEQEPPRAPSAVSTGMFHFPKGTIAGGGPSNGWLENAVQLVPSRWCDVRCAAHAYGTDHTLTKLLEALAAFRERTKYTGQIMIGDISRRHGGEYGPHLSHQSGRDIDIWLIPLGGHYRQGCPHCGTNDCRPEPDTEVNWDLTWRLVQALDELPKVNNRSVIEMIFLSAPQQKQLLAAAIRAKTDAATLKRMIQFPRKGWPALVQDSPGHDHHMHARFRCGPDDTLCE